MKNQMTLKINTPCHENYNNFTPTSKGGHCKACSKEVIDFTGMSSEEIVDFFQKKSSKNTCGRFRTDQLTDYNYTVNRSAKKHLLKKNGLAFLSLFAYGTVTAQKSKALPIKSDNDHKPREKATSIQQKKFTVKGIVSDESGPLPAVFVSLENSSVIAETNFDGYFKFPKPLAKGDVLVFSFIGYKSKKVVINGKNNSLDVHLKVQLDNSSCVLLGKVNVKKRYSSKKK